jgi:hypothetical protein
MTNLLRTLIAAVFLGLAAFSVFGFMSSFEPGVGVGWKIGYAVVCISSVGLSALPWAVGQERHR